MAKDFSAVHTVSSLAQQLQMSRWGIWKIIKKLEKDELITLKSTGSGKTSTQTIHLNLGSTLADKTVALALAQEADIYKRWKFAFADLEKTADFIILFGSILHSPKTAGDIDLLTVAKERNLLKINNLIYTIQQTQEKKMHTHNLTPKECAQELKKPNPIFLDALKRGVILFGYDNYLQFAKRFLR